MIAFLNERSLEQHADWVTSLNGFLIAAQELAAAKTALFRDSEFFQRPAFKQQFNTLSIPKDVRALIRDLVFGTRYYNCWRPGRESEQTEIFTCARPALAFRDESVSEAAERKLRDGNALIAILSAANSAFGPEATLVITKESSSAATELQNLAVPNVKQWIASQKGHYDVASRAAPRDFQTVLEKEPQRFRYTGTVERRSGRRVFEELQTGRLYYVDDGHQGLTAHLEVFSPQGQHLGTADIQIGDLKEGTRVSGRYIKL